METILQIDDDPACQMLLKQSFKINDSAANLLFANSGEVALILLRKRKADLGWSDFMPQVILTDVNMPMMSGLQFLKACIEEFGRSAFRETKVGVCTSMWSPDIEKDYDTLGIQYIPFDKPVMFENVFQKMT